MENKHTLSDFEELVRALQSAVDTIEWIYGCTEPATDEIEKAIRNGKEALAKAKGAKHD